MTEAVEEAKTEEIRETKGVPGDNSTTIDLKPKVDDIQIEVIDDTPEEDRGRPRRKEGEEPKVPDDDEIKSYSDNVQRRIKDLKREYHEERRLKEERERQLTHLLEYTKKTLDDNNKLRHALAGGEKLLIDQAKGRVDSELERARKAVKDAYEAGDGDALVKASEALAKLQVESVRVAEYQPRYQPPAAAQQETLPPRPQPVQPSDPRAARWAEQNTWFLRDQEMTRYAQGVHEHLVRQEGVDPRTEQYWEKLDSAIHSRFPERFEASSKTEKPQVVVAPASRSVGTQRKVQLTASEVQVAKKLGISLEKYAAQKLKELNR